MVLKRISNFFIKKNNKKVHHKTIEECIVEDPLLTQSDNSDEKKYLESTRKNNSKPQTVIRFNILPKKNKSFDWSLLSKVFNEYALTQTNRGYFIKQDNKRNILFSVVSMTEPGFFPSKYAALNRSFCIQGISLFMFNEHGVFSELTLNEMLKLTNKLAVKLNGNVLDDKLQNLTQSHIDELFELTAVNEQLLVR